MRAGTFTLLLVLLLLTTAPAAALQAPTDTVSEDEFVRMVLSFLTGGEDAPDLATVEGAASHLAIPSKQSRTVTDLSGRQITLDGPVKRVVVFNGETLETMRTLGVDPSLVVGVDKYSVERESFFPEYRGTPVVGSIWSPDYEQVITLQPDTVFLYATTSKESCDEIQRKLEDSIPGVKVFRFDCFTPETYADEVLALGTIFGKETRAERFATFYTGALENLSAANAGAPEGERPTVYLENWKDYKTGSAGSGYEKKITLAGGKNIFSDLPTDYPEVDPEAVIAADPDVIVKLIGEGAYPYGGYADTENEKVAEVYDSLAARPGWQSLTAVKGDRLHLLHNNIFGGPQHFIGMTYLAEWYYPDLASTLDPQSLHRTYLKEFQHLDIDPADRIFVYP
ncbi:ABC transporter substrate-binding protein [Methanofollis formosanus]|uniref:ABC transporter substrate-binding protein n=1 Tax=Methanofollis formosanus TaxID=299308 RepID=A0A8G1A3C9_9EURY|nr:ABC transporter substrate-binding protein [Methanofollis formosanus]QYZ80315.1 ABC transporter substrate-binding protein [Methanofollis formosanus]